MVERTTCSARAVHVESEACDSASREMKCAANRESQRHQTGLSGATDMRQRAQEIVALTNMKWNSTEGIGRYPITVGAAAPREIAPHS
jgi:hypothetical protein